VRPFRQVHTTSLPSRTCVRYLEHTEHVNCHNPGIAGDATWNSFAVTAPDPSYPGAHATISEAAATVLSAFFGEHLQLAVTSDGDPGVTRSFGSFQSAANEATLSRLFAGQHTMIDLVAGQHLGQQVARFVLDHLESAPASAR
jgi:membrane-associated phospholipid phosphatase